MPKPYLKILQPFPKAPKIQFISLSVAHKAFVSWLLLAFLSIICHHQPTASAWTHSLLFSVFPPEHSSRVTFLDNLSWNPNLRHAPPLGFCMNPVYASWMHYPKVEWPKVMCSWKVNSVNILTPAPSKNEENVSLLERDCQQHLVPHGPQALAK